MDSKASLPCEIVLSIDFEHPLLAHSAPHSLLLYYFQLLKECIQLFLVLISLFQLLLYLLLVLLIFVLAFVLFLFLFHQFFAWLL